MPKIISTADLLPGQPPSYSEREWVYCGLDCCVTMEILDVIEPQLTNTTRATYNFRFDLQAPVLDMSMRGIRIDPNRKSAAIEDYGKIARLISSQLDRILRDGFGIDGLNHRSPAQLKEFFYTYLRLPEVKKRNAQGVYAASVDRDSLEHLATYWIAQPFVSRILLLRDVEKKIKVLETEMDSDGRLRTSYNIAGTETGRFSSSLSEFGSGGNLQNIEKKLRSVFVPDPGKKFCEIDLEQAESRAVGAIIWNLFQDPTYLDACESGDLHTSVCRMAWPNLPWTGDPKHDKDLAEQPFYRQHSYRFMSKKLGHGSNYGGTARTLANQAKIETNIVREFQTRYFAAFPGILRWHTWVARTLLSEGQLTTFLGMQRDFWGRRDDSATLRAAIAFEPQSVVGQLLNQGLLNLWRANICELLLQIHDAVLFQFPEELESQIVSQATKLLEIPIPLRHGRTLIIPAEAKTGWNWAPKAEDNPDGLAAPSNTRRRTTAPPTA